MIWSALEAIIYFQWLSEKTPLPTNVGGGVRFD